MVSENESVWNSKPDAEFHSSDVSFVSTTSEVDATASTAVNKFGPISAKLRSWLHSWYHDLLEALRVFNDGNNFSIYPFALNNSPGRTSVRNISSSKKHRWRKKEKKNVLKLDWKWQQIPDSSKKLSLLTNFLKILLYLSF